MKKLVLEELLDDEEIVEPVGADLTITRTDLDDTEELTDEERINFNVNLITDILKTELDVYSTLTAYLADDVVKDDARTVLESIADDIALVIGKLQSGFKSAAGDAGDVVREGEDAIEEITPAENTSVEPEETPAEEKTEE